VFTADQKDIAAAVKLLAPASKHVKQLLFVHDEHGARMEAAGNGIMLRRFFNRVGLAGRVELAVTPTVLSKWLKVLSGPVSVTAEVNDDSGVVLKLSTLLRTVEVATVKPITSANWMDGCVTPVRWDAAQFRQAAGVASSDGSRPIIEAVQVLAGTLAATDSYRLVVVTNTASLPGQPGVLVPAAAAVVMGDGQVEAFTDAGTDHVQWTTGVLEVQVRCPGHAVDQFPAWENLPPKRQHEVAVAAGVVAAVDVVMKVRATKASAPVRLIGDEAGWDVKYRDDTGAVSTRVAASDVAELGTVGFNPEYLRDALALLEAHDGATVMSWGDSPPHGPRLFRSESVQGVRVVLMPVRVE
jgi:hypothetical protein